MKDSGERGAELSQKRTSAFEVTPMNDKVIIWRVRVFGRADTVFIAPEDPNTEELLERLKQLLRPGDRAHVHCLEITRKAFRQLGKEQ